MHLYEQRVLMAVIVIVIHIISFTIHKIVAL